MGTAGPSGSLHNQSKIYAASPFFEAVFWIARIGSPWRDLPPGFGKWNTVFKRFCDWVKADVFQRLFDALSDQQDMEYVMLDATIVRQANDMIFKV